MAAVGPPNGTGAAICVHNNDPLKQCADENVPGQHFNDWKKIKLQFRGRNFKLYVDTNLLAQRTLDAPFTKLYTFTITQWSTRAEIDYIRIDDTAGVYLYNEEFNDATNLAIPKPTTRCDSCGARFSNYYNSRKGSLLTLSNKLTPYMQFVE